MPKTHPEAQKCRWSGYLQENCSCGHFSSSHRCTDPPYQPALSPGWCRHTCRKQAECLFFPAATGLTGPHGSHQHQRTTLCNSPCLPERALQEKEKENSVSLLSSPLVTDPPNLPSLAFYSALNLQLLVVFTTLPPAIQIHWCLHKPWCK